MSRAGGATSRLEMLMMKPKVERHPEMKARLLKVEAPPPPPPAPAPPPAQPSNPLLDYYKVEEAPAPAPAPPPPASAPEPIKKDTAYYLSSGKKMYDKMSRGEFPNPDVEKQFKKELKKESGWLYDIHMMLSDELRDLDFCKKLFEGEYFLDGRIPFFDSDDDVKLTGKEFFDFYLGEGQWHSEGITTPPEPKPRVYPAYVEPSPPWKEDPNYSEEESRKNILNIDEYIRRQYSNKEGYVDKYTYQQAIERVYKIQLFEMTPTEYELYKTAYLYFKGPREPFKNWEKLTLEQAITVIQVFGYPKWDGYNQVLPSYKEAVEMRRPPPPAQPAPPPPPPAQPAPPSPKQEPVPPPPKKTAALSDVDDFEMVPGKMYYMSMDSDTDYHAIWEKLKGAKVGKFVGWLNIMTSEFTGTDGVSFNIDDFNVDK